MRQFLILFIISPVLLLGQQIVPLSPKDFPEGIITRTEDYDSESLLYYFTGEANMYLEYGFSSLLVQVINLRNDNFKVEVFQMNSPEAAFGIYSLSLMKCISTDTIISFDCYSRMHYQAAYGKLYIKLTSESGDEFTRQRFISVAKTIMQKNPQAAFSLPEPFDSPYFRKNPGTLIFVKGPVGLQNSLIPFQNYFLGVRFAMYAIPLSYQQGDLYFSRITFLTPGDQYIFLKAAGLMSNNVPISNTVNANGLYNEFRQIDPLSIYFLQCQQPNRPYPIDAVLMNSK